MNGVHSMNREQRRRFARVLLRDLHAAVAKDRDRMAHEKERIHRRAERLKRKAARQEREREQA